jgi:hypothetical protein
MQCVEHEEERCLNGALAGSMGSARPQGRGATGGGAVAGGPAGGAEEVQSGAEGDCGGVSLAGELARTGYLGSGDVASLAATASPQRLEWRRQTLIATLLHFGKLDVF